MENNINIPQIERIVFLIKKYREASISKEEQFELDGWIHQRAENKAVFERLLNDEAIGETLLSMEKASVVYSAKSIFSKAGIGRRFIGWTYYRIAAAAVVVLLLGAGFYLFDRSHKPALSDNRTASIAKDVLPAGNGAVLTLADGSRIVLDSAQNGNIATQGNVKIVKQNGRLVYMNAKTGAIISGDNTVTTPNGKQFQLALPDGTKVWLNAGSSITYPVAFSGLDRMVAMSGEAYFEVAHDAARPFVVNVNKTATVKVLGTHFNIDAYSTERSVKTTLLEGSVQFSSNLGSVKLRPGQQGRSNSGADIKVIDNVDLEEVMAWHSGKFIFEDASIRRIMDGIARWYNIEVDYETNIPDKYTINVSNGLTLTQLLKYIEASGGVHFEIDGRKVIVKK